MSSPLPPPPGLEPTELATPPALPSKWRATALLTPFPDNGTAEAPWAAEITYDWSVQAMRVSCYSLDGGSADILAVGAGTYYVLEDGGCYGPYSQPEWSVPSPTWLASRDLVCNGVADVLGVSCQWWSGTSPCTNCMEHEGSTPSCADDTWCAGTWVWARADNGFPWRIMLISQGNPYQLPVLGDCALVHLPTFEEVAGTKLPQILANCPNQGAERPAPGSVAEALRRSAQSATDEQRRSASEAIGSLIPGLAPLPGTCAPYALPTWPTTLYMTAITTPTFPYQETPTGPWYTDPYPTEIFYDTTDKQAPKQLSRFYQPDGTIQDTLLLEPTSYGVDRDADGNVTSCGLLDPNPNDPNIGAPVWDWPANDGATCLAQITNNPQLSPGKTTLIIGCPSDQGRVFYIWYTSDAEAVMFTEVPQCCDVSLTLIDYDTYMADPELPPGIFDIPPQCQQAATSRAAARRVLAL
jgi:hypothetical protein